MIKEHQPDVMFPAFGQLTLDLLNLKEYTEEDFRSVRTIFNVGPAEQLVSFDAKTNALYGSDHSVWDD